MPPSLRSTLTRLVPGLTSVASVASAGAGELTASIEIPQLNVAEYHRPYVAVWIETPKRAFAANVAVKYDVEMADNEGETWLKDLRQWWRKSGRELDLPLDGVSGPTLPVGTHDITVATSAPALSELPAGNYVLVVEASREVGGRELVRVPFAWGANQSVEASAAGKSELGNITLRISQP
ncbi:DUF2271 domain-containing protein [Synoicihabitans lomoniglobus]|uniref:DUF2271 domain-containing protein n=1 Tax=Synoicihabitans lomoniglobus TaxID=2909285 RepID=A0AAF0A164_9BACT|nr:DUF2271 domain-containing protein [Opitutaceae bacterium LMO-M01]WED65503.1 DUF2271 domain-containing protein [Opitutaceae bacterium LMO-M01]